MATYIISYDLNKQKDYPALYEAIKALGTWCHPVDSPWLVVSDLSASSVRDHLKEVMDGDDALLVCRASTPGAWTGLSSLAGKWLQANL